MRTGVQFHNLERVISRAQKETNPGVSARGVRMKSVWAILEFVFSTEESRAYLRNAAARIA